MAHHAPHSSVLPSCCCVRALRLAAPLLFACTLLWPAPSAVQIKAVARPGAIPAWDKGMIAITSESYYHAIECGKQGGDDPACVFWDTGLCKNDDFTLTFYSGYKQVAYEVWTAVREEEARAAAQLPGGPAVPRCVTIAVAPAPGSKNTLTGFAVKRGGKPVQPAVRTLSGGTGNFTYD